MAGLDGMNNRLNRPVDDKRDHILGPHHAPITLVVLGPTVDAFWHTYVGFTFGALEFQMPLLH